MTASKRVQADQKKAEGNAAFKQKDYHGAIQHYTEAIEIDNSSHVYFSNRSASYAGLQQYNEAVADANECIRIDSSFVKGYHRKAAAQQGLKTYIAALETLKVGQKIDFNNKDLNKLATEIQPLAEAEELAKRSGKSPEELLKLKGNDAFKVAAFDQAIGFYTQALKTMSSPTCALAISCYNNRAACYQQMSDYSSVIGDCTHVLDIDSTNQKALLRRGLAYEGLEKYRLALQDIRFLLGMNPHIEVANKAQHRIGQAVRTLKQQQQS